MATEFIKKTYKDITTRFSYHKPDGLAIIAHSDVREACLTLALTLEQLLPDGREKSVAMTKVEEAMFWANAAIAREKNSGGA